MQRRKASNRSMTTDMIRIMLSLCVMVWALGAAAAAPRHAIAMHGEPALGSDFTQFGFVNPQAPKGGRMVRGVLGSFDSLNPFIVRGQAVGVVRSHVFEALMVRNPDEPFTLYAHIAESIEVPEDRSSITFNLRSAARFSDGRPITVDDVVFTLELLRDKGWPNLRTYYSKVERIERIGERSVRFSFPSANDRELPLILGLMPILPKHRIDPARFEETTLEPMVGSGPYTITAVDPGGSLTLRRDPNWWAADLPTTRGLFNFDEIKIEYFRDANSLFEAFRKGLIDFRAEDDPTRWATGYDFPAAREGRVVLETFTTGLPKPMAAFVFNTRRAVFEDIRVRQGLIELFDFEWINANLFNGAFRRTGSFFEGSELSALGQPAGEREQRLLAPFAQAVSADVMAGTWRPPVSDGSGLDRQRIARGMELLRAAGFRTNQGKLVDRNNRPLAFEVVVATRDQERVLLAWKRILDRVGIDMSIRQVDSAQFERRRQGFEFDMMPMVWGSSLSPGNEQTFRWGSRAADQPGSFNLSGLKSPAADAMIAQILSALTREDLVSAVRALDRVLMSAQVALPLYHLPEQRIARWTTMARPERPALSGQAIDAWWRARQ